MPRRTLPPANPSPTPPPGPAVPASGLTEEQVRRWADLIAEGRDAFPTDLPAPDRTRLLEAVRLRLQGRLVRLIARAIAAGLHPPDWHQPENWTDA